MGKTKILKCNSVWNIISEFENGVKAAEDAGVKKHKIYESIKNNKQLNGYFYKLEIIEINKINKPIKCPYCERTFDSYNGLSKHVIKAKMHGDITQEKLLSDYYYNGLRPLCKCGCGKETEIIWTGTAHFGDYLKGHYSVVHNNWGHNQKAIKNSSESRRNSYKYGERIQWNKGKTWGETYTNEQILKLHEKYKSKKFARSSKAEKDFAFKYLDSMNIEYEPQKYISSIKQFSDFYHYKSDTYIEFNGDFWHNNPDIYIGEPIYKTQKNKVEKDKIKYEWIKNNGSNLIIIWENDVKNNEEKILKLLEPLLD
jgi:uncharacterized C2H2 Zn-finger protein/G:T-mismatch repair DNA endonuclease (very short patch repair protein)